MGSHTGRASDGTDGDGVAVYGAVPIADKMAPIRAVTLIFRLRGATGRAGRSLGKT